MLWSAPIPVGSVKFDPKAETASLQVKNVLVFDGFDVPNALNTFHPEGHVNSILNSLKMTWSGTIQHRSYSNCDPNAFRGDFFEDLATIEVTATTPPVPARDCPVTPARHGFRFVSDPADKGTTTVHFAQIGREKNGVFY